MKENDAKLVFGENHRRECQGNNRFDKVKFVRIQADSRSRKELAELKKGKKRVTIDRNKSNFGMGLGIMMKLKRENGKT